MLSSFREKSFREKIDSWETKALAEALKEMVGGREFLCSYSIGEEECKDNVNIILPRTIIPNTLTLCAFTFVCEENIVALPILLKYFIHKKLLEVAKVDLSIIYQDLQSVMDKDLEDIQAWLAEEKISELSDRVKEINSCKKDIETLFSGENYNREAVKGTYSQKYCSILKAGLIKIVEENLTVYVDNDTDIKKVYQSLNNKAKKEAKRIDRLQNISTVIACITIIFCGVSTFAIIIKAAVDNNPLIFALIFANAIIFIMGCVIATIVWPSKEGFRQSFVKELVNYIENLECIDGQPGEQEKMYPNLSEVDDDHLLDGQKKDQNSVLSDLLVDKNLDLRHMHKIE